MRTLEVTISPDGTVQFLYDASLAEVVPTDAIIKRASHVLPQNLFLRLLFRGLRLTLGEYGKVAAFTRTWHCLWYVDLSPVGGPTLPQRFRNRAEAIAAEVAWLNEFFI